VILLLQSITFLAIVAASPVAPWWAAPVEHIALAVLGFLGIAIGPATAAWQGWKTRQRVDEKRIESHVEHGQTSERLESIADDVKVVHEEVRTANAMKLGGMADDAETRRVAKIAPGDRTAEESEHILTVPEKH